MSRALALRGLCLGLWLLVPLGGPARAEPFDLRALLERATARLEGRVGGFGVVRIPGQATCFELRPGMAVADGKGRYRSSSEALTREIPRLKGQFIPGTSVQRLVVDGTQTERHAAQHISIFLSEDWRPRDANWRQLPAQRTFTDRETTSGVYGIRQRPEVTNGPNYERIYIESVAYRYWSGDRAIEVQGRPGRLAFVRHEGRVSIPKNSLETEVVSVNRAVSLEGYVMLETPAGPLGVRVKASEAARPWIPAMSETEFLGLLDAVVWAVTSELPRAEPVEPEPEPADEPEPEPEPETPEVRLLRLYDANPLFTDGLDVATVRDPADLLGQVRQHRTAVAADGVSRVLVRLDVDAPGRVALEVGDDDGTLRMLFGGKTYEDENGSHHAFALYEPPGVWRPPAGDASAPGAGFGFRIGQVAAARSVPVTVRYDPAREGVPDVVAQRRLRIVRPPVLLVHGTFDNPRSCWTTTLPFADTRHGRESMAQALADTGFTTFLVDYEGSNGSPHGHAELSAFRYNRRVLWANPGGIYDALRAYREELHVAATQVDVVGHSLGGIIPRLWASDAYNPPGSGDRPVFDRKATSGYRRPDNFEAGDIHRLVTLCSTHGGSDLGQLAHVMQGVPRRFWQETTGIAAMQDRLIYFARLAGYAVTPAVLDQLPNLPSMPNGALERIGATRVPSHAVVCWATLANLADFGTAVDLLPRLGCWCLLNLRPEVVQAFLRTRNQEQTLERIFGEVLSLDGRHADPSGDAPGDWLRDPAYRLAPNDQAVVFALFRAAIFGNTQNDFVVRVESQAGGLPLQYTTPIGDVMHSFAPHYHSVQRAVVRLLDGPDTLFCAEGFPPPPFLRQVEPFTVDQDPAERARIVAASGIVPSHAEALSFVAMQQNVVILVRPVNRNATALIATHNATKDMHVKGKSASWGPQKGYIPVEQRFSKLHFTKTDREEKIRNYDGEVTRCLSTGRATQSPLVRDVGGQRCEVLVVEGVEDPEEALVLRDETGAYHGWKNGPLETFDVSRPPAALALPPADIEARGTRPLMVLADARSGRPLTADYDLLAFATRFAPQAPRNDPEMGGIRPYQVELLRAINNEVRVRANYLGGNVSHHGPEVLFPQSPGADYPITAFEPSGYVVGIPEGRRGRSDYWLKRYFHHLKCRGWRIEPNAHTWNWGTHDPETWPGIGYEPDDHNTTVPDSPGNPHDSDEGDDVPGRGGEGEP